MPLKKHEQKKQSYGVKATHINLFIYLSRVRNDPDPNEPQQLQGQSKDNK